MSETIAAIDCAQGRSVEPQSTNHNSASQNHDKQLHSPPAAIRLMLHTYDGVIPYLTPNLLHQHCRWKQYHHDDILMIGEAVRDTCIVPILPLKRDGDIDAGDDAKKPRGYRFEATVPDAWMRQGICKGNVVTVPTFDLAHDHFKKRIEKRPKARATVDNSPFVAFPCVHLWTPNGRMKIQDSEYWQAIQGRQAFIAVPLYDALPITSVTADNTNSQRTHDIVKKQLKQRQIVAHNNHQWLTRSIKQMMQTTSATAPVRLWAPLAVNGNTDFTKCQGDQNTLRHVLETIQKHVDVVTTVVLVGWQHIHDEQQRSIILETVMAPPINEGVPMNPPPSVAVLSTSSLSQILQLLTCLSKATPKVVIGTELPSLWARDKKVFVCDIASWITSDQKTNPSEHKRRKLNPKEDDGPSLLDADGCIRLADGICDPDGENQHWSGRSISDHPWFQDDQSLVPGCACLTCSSHTRSYVYHLVCSKELLAEILIFIHNLHHLLELVRVANDCHRNHEREDPDNESCTSIQRFCNHIRSQLATES
jgi:hypothetical protein